MAESLSLLAYQEGKEAQQKLDAFLVGICGALFAYIGQTYEPRKLALDASLFDPISLILLAVAFFAGLKRMEAFINCSRFNFHILDAGKNIGGLMEIAASGRTEGFFKSSGETFSIDQLPKRLAAYKRQKSEARILFDREAAKALRYYNLRNAFLLLGFLVILASRLATPYMPTNKQEPTPQAPTQSQPGHAQPSNPHPAR